MLECVPTPVLAIVPVCVNVPRIRVVLLSLAIDSPVLLATALVLVVVPPVGVPHVLPAVPALLVAVAAPLLSAAAVAPTAVTATPHVQLAIAAVVVAAALVVATFGFGTFTTDWDSFK